MAVFGPLATACISHRQQAAHDPYRTVIALGQNCSFAGVFGALLFRARIALRMVETAIGKRACFQMRMEFGTESYWGAGERLCLARKSRLLFGEQGVDCTFTEKREAGR